jgi:hypothetical protein
MASGFSSKQTRRQIERELFAALDGARQRYENAGNELRILMETAAASLGTADGSFTLEKTDRLSGIANRALLDYEEALKACTDFVLNGGLV